MTTARKVTFEQGNNAIKRCLKAQRGQSTDKFEGVFILQIFCNITWLSGYACSRSVAKFNHSLKGLWMPFRLPLFVIALTLIANSVVAQSSFMTPVDESFFVQGHGPSVQVSGETAYPLVTVHKVVQRNERTFVCLGLAGLVRREFVERSRVISSGGKVVKSGFRVARDFNNAPKFVAKRRSGDQPQGLFLTIYPTRIDWYIGEMVRCRRSNKKFQQEFVSERSFVSVPEKVWVTK